MRSNLTSTSTVYSNQSSTASPEFTISEPYELVIFYLVPSVLGMASELVCFILFVHVKVNSRLYTYLRAYCVNDFLICCSILLLFFYQFLIRTGSRLMTLVNAYVTLQLLYSCYLNSTFLNIAILLDRISVLNTRVKRWTRLISPYKQIILFAFISIVFNIPHFFTLSIHSWSFESDDGSKHTIWYSGFSPLVFTQTGFIVNMFVVVVNFGLAMAVQISFNVRSIFYIRKHLKNKSIRVIATQSQNIKYQNMDVKTSVMVTILCAVSFIEHILLAVCNITMLFPSSQFNISLIRKLTLAFFGMKRFSDFFFYLKFNKIFRKQFLLSCGCTRHCVAPAQKH